MMKCLIVDKMHEGIVPMLQDIGFQVDYLPEISRQDMLAGIAQYHGIIIRSKTKFDQEIVSKASNLQFVARAGAGIDNLEVDSIKKAGIRIINAPEGNRDTLAEHTVGMALSLLHKISKSHREISNNVWHREDNRGEELMGKTFAIVGYGNMGTAVARRLKNFGCKVIAYDKYKKDFSDDFCDEVDMETVFEEADLLSLHIPLSGETHQLVDLEYLNKFKKSIYLINTSRGEILCLKSLKYLLETNRIKGAALDVLENEKIDQLSGETKEIFNYLAHNQHVILTPHIAGWSEESYQRINQILAEKIKAFINR